VDLNVPFLSLLGQRVVINIITSASDRLGEALENQGNDLAASLRGDWDRERECWGRVYPDLSIKEQYQSKDAAHLVVNIEGLGALAISRAENYLMARLVVAPLQLAKPIVILVTQPDFAME
jgi:hypothetical protein